MLSESPKYSPRASPGRCPHSYEGDLPQTSSGGAPTALRLHAPDAAGHALRADGATSKTRPVAVPRRPCGGQELLPPPQLDPPEDPPQLEPPDEPPQLEPPDEPPQLDPLLAPQLELPQPDPGLDPAHHTAAESVYDGE
jgi:hypothetical protein